MRSRTCHGRSLSTRKFLGGVLLIGLLPLLLAADSSPGSKKNPAAKAKRLPSQVDLRPEFTELGLGPRRQGKRGTCSVFTTTAALEFALAKLSGQGVPLSVEYLNWASNQSIRQNLDGGFFHDLLKGLEQHGVCSEADMPYQRHYDENLAPSEQTMAVAAEILKQPLEVHWINPWKPKTGLTDEQLLEIKSVLAAGWPVAAGSSHSRLLVGYVDDPEQPGGGTLLTKDSGSGRFASISYEFAKEKVGDVFWIESRAKRKGKKAKS